MSVKQKRFKWFRLLFAASLLLALVSCMPWPGGGRGGPVGPRHITAETCADFSDGETCSFTDLNTDEVKSI